MKTEIIWRGVVIEIRHTPNWLGTERHHVEIEARPRTPLPVTETGYRSAFLAPDALEDYRNAAAFVQEWLDEAALDWEGQLTLF